MKKFFSLVAVALLGTSLWAKTDVTSTYLTNAGLTSLDGWSIGTDFGGNGYNDYKTDGDVPVIEFYHSWTGNAATVGTAIGTTKTFNFSQKPTLKAGYYRLQVNAFYREGNGTGSNTKAYIYAGEKQQYVVGLTSTGVASYTGSNDLYKAANAFSKGDFSNEFDFHVTNDTTLEVGFHGYIDTYCSWCILGPVHLYEYTAADYMDAVQARNAVAKALVDPMDSTINATLQKAIAAVDSLKATNTVDDVLVAQDALNSAITAANTSIAEYKTLKAVFDEANALDETGAAYFTTAAGAVIANYNNGGYTSEAIAAAVALAKETLSAAVLKQTTPGANFTAAISNWDFTGCVNNSFPGWTILAPNGGNTWANGTSNVEYWIGTAADGAFDYYQEVNNLPMGKYILTAKMWNSSNSTTGVPSGECGVYGTSGDSTVFAGVTDDIDNGSMKEYTTDTIPVTNGTLRLGVKNNTTMVARWFGVDYIKLTFVEKIVVVIPVESVSLGEDFEMTVGDEPKTIVATVLPDTASNKTLTWKSSADSVATVADGVVTAVSEGEAYIIATSNNNITDTVKVTVKAAPVEEDPIDGTYATTKLYDFASMAAADTLNGAAKKSAMTYEDETVLVAKVGSNIGNGSYEGLAMQGANKFILNNGGLYSNNGGGRKVGVLDLTKGQKVIVRTNGACMALADASNVVAADPVTADGVTTYEYTMTADGMLALTMTRYFAIYTIEIQSKCKVYRVKEWDFAVLAAADTLNGAAKKSAMTYEDETVLVAKVGSNIGNGSYEGLAMQGANKFILNNGGLYSNNGGGRKVGILDVEAGMVVTVRTNGACMALADASNAVAADPVTADGVTTYQYTITADGMLALTMTRYFTIYSITIDKSKQVIESGWDFAALAAADTLNGAAKKSAMTYEDETVLVAKVGSNIGNGSYEGLAMQGANKFILNNSGLYSNNGGGRKVGILDLQAGTVVVIRTNGACMTLADASNAVAADPVTEDGVTTYQYTMTADGMLALTMTRYFVIYSIVKYAPKSDLQQPAINVLAHSDWEVAPVILTCKTKGAKISYQLSNLPDTTFAYEDTIKVLNSATLSCWSELNGKTSKVVTKALTAGYVATPTAALTAAKNETRTVTLADVATPAVITYSIDGAEFVKYTEPFIISNNIDLKVAATVDSVYFSDTLTTSFEAGTTIQLNEVAFATVEQSADSWTIIANNSVSDIIGTPATTISYELYPSKETGTVNPGDTLTLATHQRITATASAEGYATSEATELWLRKPANLELVWEVNFDTVAYLVSDKTTPTVSAETFTAGGTSFGQVTVGDSAINANFGAVVGGNYLVRSQNVNNTGLEDYNTSSALRYVGIANLKKTQVVKFFNYRWDNASYTDLAGLFPSYNDVLEYDAANSTASHMVFNVVKDGNARLAVARYLVFKDVAVYNNPDVTASPNIYIAGKEDDARKVTVIPAEVEYPANQFTYYSVANGTKVDSTLVAEATESTPAVYSYDTVAVYTDFAPVEGQFSVSKPNNTVVAYTEYEGKASEQTVVTIDCDSIYSLILPTISWVEKDTTNAHVFEVANSNLTEAGLYPELNVTYNDSKDVLYGSKNELAIAGSGWLKVQAVLPGMDTAYVVSRYVAENRESYNENYDAIIDGDTLTAGSYAGDVEFQAGAAVSGEYPTKNILVGGTQFFHKAVNSYYSTFTLPFAFTAGKNVVTDAKGNELVAGEDYEIATLTNLKNGNIYSSTDASTLINEGNADACVRTSALAAGTPVMFHALSEKVGSEVIISSVAKAAVTYAAASTAMPTSGYKVYGNKRYQTVALDTAAYVLNAKGTQLVYTNKPTVAPMQVAVLADSATVATLGKTIVLVDMSYKYTALELTKDTLIWLNQTDMIAANAAGWAATDNEDNYASFKTSSKSYTINPATDEEVSSTKYTGIDVKNNTDKYLNLYVSGVDSLVVYALSTGSASRTVKVESIPVAGEATSAESEASTGNTVKVSLKPSTTGVQKIRISGPDGDMMVYAIKFIYGEPTGIQNVAAEQMEIDAIYDLQGRKANELKAGEIYIINGRRYMVK